MKKKSYASLLVALFCFFSYRKKHYLPCLSGSNLFVYHLCNISLENSTFFWIDFKNTVISYSFLLLCFLLFIVILGVKQYKLKNDRLKREIINTENLLHEMKLYRGKTKNKIPAFFDTIKKELDCIKDAKRKNQKKIYLIQNQIYFIVIAEIINKQKKYLKKINTPESINLYKDTESMQATGNIFVLQGYIIKNNRWIEEYKYTKIYIRDIIIKLRKGLYVEGVTNLLLNELLDIKKEYNTVSLDVIKYRIAKQLAIFQGKNSNESIVLIKNEITAILICLEELKYFESYCIYNKKFLKYYLELSDFSGCIWELLYSLKKIKQQINILSILKEIRDLSNDYKQNIDYINRENNLKIDRHIINTLYAETTRQNREIADKINEYIYLFFTSISKSDFHLITNILKINNFKSQNAKILVLLLADKNIKRTVIPGILGVYSNLNPIISRLINDRIKSNQKKLEEFGSKKKFCVIIKIMLDLLK